MRTVLMLWRFMSSTSLTIVSSETVRPSAGSASCRFTPLSLIFFPFRTNALPATFWLLNPTRFMRMSSPLRTTSV